jgi:hypothetical protein
MLTDGETDRNGDMTKLIAALRNFAKKAPKNCKISLFLKLLWDELVQK